MSCGKMAEPIDLQFGLWTRVGRRKLKFSRIHHVAPMCPHVNHPSVVAMQPYVKLLWPLVFDSVRRDKLENHLIYYTVYTQNIPLIYYAVAERILCTSNIQSGTFLFLIFNASNYLVSQVILHYYSIGQKVNQYWFLNNCAEKCVNKACFCQCT